jgi:hypothetical protein
MALEVEIGYDSFLEEAGKISGSGDTITRPYLLGNRATA